MRCRFRLEFFIKFVVVIIEYLFDNIVSREVENFGGDNEIYLFGFLYLRNFFFFSFWIIDIDEV